MSKITLSQLSQVAVTEELNARETYPVLIDISFRVGDVVSELWMPPKETLQLWLSLR